MNTISPLSSIQPVGSSTSQSGGRGQNDLPGQGQTFKAVVAEAKGNNTFVLEFLGNRVSAQAKMPLSVGQILQLQVASTAPQIELRVVDDSTNLFKGKSLTLLGENINVRSLFQNIQNTVPSPLTQLSAFSRQTLESFFSFNQNSLQGNDSGNMLKQFVDRLGLSMESFLARGDNVKPQATLKAALLEMAALFKGAGELAESTNRLINTLELYQLAQLQLEKDDTFIFPLPVPFLEKGYLIIDGYGSKKHNESEEEQQSFSLHLALEGLGSLKIDIVKMEEGIYLRFVSADQEKLNFIEQFKDDLLLNTVDTTILGVTFVKEQIDPAADLLKRLLPDGESIVNTKI